MGAGISQAAKHARKYRALKKIERELHAAGIPCQYRNEEVRGVCFNVYFAACGPASNGESFAWLVLRFNGATQPEGVVKRKGDVDYTDFHTRDIAEHSKGGFRAGVQRVKRELGLMSEAERNEYDTAMAVNA
jgi:hypothetical protein